MPCRSEHQGRSGYHPEVLGDLTVQKIELPREPVLEGPYWRRERAGKRPLSSSDGHFQAFVPGNARQIETLQSDVKRACRTQSCLITDPLKLTQCRLNGIARPLVAVLMPEAFDDQIR